MKSFYRIFVNAVAMEGESVFCDFFKDTYFAPMSIANKESEAVHKTKKTNLQLYKCVFFIYI